MLEKYAAFCYDQIGSYILGYVDLFKDLKPQLSRANLQISLPEYVAMMFFTSGAVSFFTFFVLGTAMVLGSGIAGLIIALGFTLVSGVGTLLFFHIYPSIVIRDRASKIRDQLPFATLYMSTLSGTGTEVTGILKILSEQEEYGEVAREAERIHRDVENFGMDISHALRKAAERTPSEDFEELMWGMNHVITSGGSLREFLRGRSERLMNDYKRRVEKFSEQLGMFVEMYITLVIVGSIMFTSMSTVMSSFTTFPPSTIAAIQMLTIFFGLPLISGMFILLIKGISPGGVR